MTNKTTLNPVIAAGISTTFQRPSAFARLAGVTPYQLGRLLDGKVGDVASVRRVEQAWGVLDPFKLREAIGSLPASRSTADQVTVGKLLTALDLAYEALTGVELIAVDGE